MRSRSYWLMLLAMMGCLLCCKKTIEPEPKPVEKTEKDHLHLITYGYDYSGNYHTFYRVDDTLERIRIGPEYIYYYNIAASGSDIYLSGLHEYSDDNKTYYWKNRKPVTLNYPDAPTHITASGNDVCIAFQHKDYSKAYYWRNGDTVGLENDRKRISVTAIHQFNGDVYVTGGIAKDNQFKYDAMYWKNGKAVFLTPGANESGYVADILVHGDDVYAVGQVDLSNGMRSAAYWKNGKLFKVGEEDYSPTLSGICAVGDDIYMVQDDDMESGSAVICFKNGQPIDMEDNKGYIYVAGMFAHGNDVYIYGHESSALSGSGAPRSSVVYWKNGKKTILPNAPWMNEVYVRAMAVAKY